MQKPRGFPTGYLVRGILYGVHCTGYIVRGTLYGVHCTGYIVRGTLYRVHCSAKFCINTRHIRTRKDSSSSNLTCKGYTVTGGGLVELKS